MTLAAARPQPLRRRFASVEAVHFPLTIALPRLDPYAVTLHDVQHLDLPGLFPRAERWFRAVAWHGSVRRASLVIVPSAFVRDRAAERLALDPARIRVIPHGIDHARFHPSDEMSRGREQRRARDRPGDEMSQGRQQSSASEHPSDEMSQGREQHRARETGDDEMSRGEPRRREPFLLYPAKPWPHKNHARLLEAFALLRRERPELRLVLTGGGDTPVADGVERLGRVSVDELAGLYRSAAALVFPSRYEGFGQPPLEAMACGCPVACSDAASLPEVVGDAARLFDPGSPEEIAAAVAEVLDDPGPWRERGLARAAAFSWERSAREHEAVYRELLA